MTQLGAYFGSIVGSAAVRNRYHQFCGFIGRKADFAVDFAPDTSYAAMADASIPQGWRKFMVHRLALTMPLLPVGATFDQVIAGTHDTSITNLMVKYQEVGFQECIIRLGHEFNGTWYRWRADNGNEQKYVDAFKRTVDKIRAATHNGSSAAFLFDWCPTIGTPSNCDNELAYPGDDYVDIIGMDVYDKWFPAIADPLTRWNTLRTTTFGLDWHASFAAAHGKPMSFPEWAAGTDLSFPANSGGDNAIFVNNMAAWIKTHHFHYHGYWDVNIAFDGRITDYTFPKCARAYHSHFHQP